MKWTQRKIIHRIRIDLGLTVNVVQGEYRVNYRLHDPRYRTDAQQHEGTAYFTDDPTDALDTAEIMARVPIPERRKVEGPTEGVTV